MYTKRSDCEKHTHTALTGNWHFKRKYFSLRTCVCVCVCLTVCERVDDVWSAAAGAVAASGRWAERLCCFNRLAAPAVVFTCGTDETIEPVWGPDTLALWPQSQPLQIEKSLLFPPPSRSFFFTLFHWQFGHECLEIQTREKEREREFPVFLESEIRLS